VLIKKCAANSNVDFSSIERNLKIMKQLFKRWYSLNCEEVGCISCDIAVLPQNLAVEYKAVKSIIEKDSTRE